MEVKEGFDLDGTAFQHSQAAIDSALQAAPFIAPRAAEADLAELYAATAATERALDCTTRSSNHASTWITV